VGACWLSTCPQLIPAYRHSNDLQISNVKIFLNFRKRNVRNTNINLRFFESLISFDMLSSKVL
jgi:hypothetical protein